MAVDVRCLLVPVDEVRLQGIVEPQLENNVEIRNITNRIELSFSVPRFWDCAAKLPNM